MKLDLGCGSNKKQGFKGVDKVKVKGVDIVHDLETFPWPFKNNSVDEIFSNQLVEHVQDLMGFMNEMYRVMKPGAQATIICPYWSSIRAMQDPTHIRPISEATFLYYNKEWRSENKLDHYPITCDFDYSYGYSFTPEWVNRSDETRTFAAGHYLNVVSDIQVVLTKRES